MKKLIDSKINAVRKEISELQISATHKKIKDANKRIAEINARVKSSQEEVSRLREVLVDFERELPEIVTYLHGKYEGKGISPKTLGAMAKTMIQFKKVEIEN